MEIKRGLPLVFLFYLYSANGFGASFDCIKAKSFSEQTICGSHEISQMDDELKIVYDKAKAAYKNKVEFKNITKNMWNEREKCTSEECVRKWYSDAFIKYADMNVEAPGKDNLESEFISVVSQAQVNGSAAKNDMAVGGIKFKRDDQICSLIHDGKVNSWVGKIKSLDANSDGYGVLSIEIAPGITLKTWNNSFSDRNDQTLINPTSPFFKTVSEMAVGDDVEFSGRFIPSENGICVNEASFGLHGGLSEPEFIFKFSSVSQSKAIAKKNESGVVTPEQIEIAKQVLNAEHDYFTKVCLLVGEGKDDEAMSVIDNMVFPNGVKNETKINLEQYNGIKDYFLQYRNLTLDTCRTYSAEFLKELHTSSNG